MVECRVRLQYHGVKKEALNLSQVLHSIDLGHVHVIMFYTYIQNEVLHKTWVILCSSSGFKYKNCPTSETWQSYIDDISVMIKCEKYYHFYFYMCGKNQSPTFGEETIGVSKGGGTTST